MGTSSCNINENTINVYPYLKIKWRICISCAGVEMKNKESGVKSNEIEDIFTFLALMRASLNIAH